MCFSGPPLQGGCGGARGEAEEGKASAGGPQVRDRLHRPHADDGVDRGWGLADPKDCAPGPTGNPSWGHCSPVRTGVMARTDTNSKSGNVICFWQGVFEGMKAVRGSDSKVWKAFSNIPNRRIKKGIDFSSCVVQLHPQITGHFWVHVSQDCIHANQIYVDITLILRNQFGRLGHSHLYPSKNTHQISPGSLTGCLISIPHICHLFSTVTNLG